ncbi:MAG: hypothetical protein RL662_1941 [Bacteroidota bacterium]|jgi:acyl carrier protein
MDTIKIQEEKEQLFIKLKQFIFDIIGADIAEELQITKESNFTRDLEMDSIEIVAFAEKVKVEFGDKIDFAAWLSSMDLDQLVNLNINDIITYIVDANHSGK